ncbi:MAG: molybdenum cofactor guanylyltransferase [Candidatus Bathyarchaeota archaeon]|nr:MAG: molybdenum cofactor guanylyltransferase [Candidatus Bathyarchaeota archaeon]
METSVVVLAGGFSKRFGQDKGLLKLAGKPLILRVLDKVSPVVDEILVVVSSKSQEKACKHFLKPKAKIVIDKYETQNPLVGALTGFENADGEYSLLLPCDTPFVSSEIVLLLLELCIGKDAVIPRWPNGHIEPLQAVYCTKSALNAAKKALKHKRAQKLNMHSMIASLKKVCYVSTLVLKQIDPKLMTFFNINTPQDLRNAEYMLPAHAHARA